MEIALEIALVVLLAATLIHAVKLERALGVLKRDRDELQDLVDGFNASTRTAELGIERLRLAAEGAGRSIARQTEVANGLKDDLAFLIERGERTADQLDSLVRTTRMLNDAPPSSQVTARPAPERFYVAPGVGENAVEAPLRSQAERDLLRALRMAR